MRRPFQLAIAGISALALTGCATMDVGSHVRRGLDFTQYRTFDWGEPDALPVGDPRFDRNPFYRDHVEGAIEKQLAGRGFERAAAGRADLLIHYHASVTHRIDVDRQNQYGYRYDSAPVIEYEAVTLVLDLVDARTNRTIWRGWARHRIDGMLGNPYTMSRRVQEAVARTMKKLPGAG